MVLLRVTIPFGMIYAIGTGAQVQKLTQCGNDQLCTILGQT